MISPKKKKMSIETSFRFFVHVGYALPTERARAEKFCKAFLEIDKRIVSATATQCPSVVHLYLQAAEAEKNKEGKAPKQSDGKGVLLAAAAAAAAPTASATQIPSDANTDKNTWHLFCYPSAEERISKILQDWDAIFKTPVFPLASLSKFSMRPSSSILNLWWNKETGQVARGELQTYNMTASQVYEMVTEQESPGDSTFVSHLQAM